jgi:cephalosporin hydroxylase
VIGIDVEIRSHNRSAIESHELYSLIELVEGDSIDPGIVARVKSMVRPSERVLVVLDSRHTKEHVLGELRAYSALVTPGSYIVATDGIMGDLVGAPRSAPDWEWNNPKAAAADFARENADFVLEEPPFPFNEGMIRERVTYWPGAFLRRMAAKPTDRAR